MDTMPFLKLKSVTATEKYKLYIVFTDGVEGSYDVSHLAGKGVFKTWDGNNNFYKVAINPESGAITWPGELDIDTVAAYCGVKGISVKSYFSKEPNAAY